MTPSRDSRAARLRTRALTFAGPAVVALVGSVSAAGLWTRYWPLWRQLWTDVIHDRSAHLDFGLGAASDLAHLRWIEMMRDVNAYRTWPPLHDGVMVGLTMLASGLDPRMAVLPSLATWVGAAVVAFLIAHRLVERRGTLAGAVAAAFVLASPAGRAYATDVMIEGPGAFFTLLALYATVRVEQEGTPGRWRDLALALSAVFFVKYNYWLLVAAAVVPLFWRSLPFNSPPFKAILRWHVLPAMIWLALPGKLARFLWVLWPATNGGAFPASDRLAGFVYYAEAIGKDYQTGLCSAIIVAALLAVSVIAWARGHLRPGAGTLLLFLLLATLATAPHPNRQSRFLHSWIPVAWVAAGAGLGSLAGQGRKELRYAAIGGGVLIVAAQLPGLAATPHAPEGGVRVEHPSALELTDAYLPYLADARRPAVFSNMPLRFLARWTYLDRYGRGERVITELTGLDPTRSVAGNVDALDRWIGSSDVIVLVHIPPSSPWYQNVPGTAGLRQLDDLLSQQTSLHQVLRREFPERGGAIVTIWRVGQM